MNDIASNPVLHIATRMLEEASRSAESGVRRQAALVRALLDEANGASPPGGRIDAFREQLGEELVRLRLMLTPLARAERVLPADPARNVA